MSLVGIMELELHARQQAAAEPEDEAKAKERKKWGPLRDLMEDFGWEASFRMMSQNCPPELVKSCRDLHRHNGRRATQNATPPPQPIEWARRLNGR